MPAPCQRNSQCLPSVSMPVRTPLPSFAEEREVVVYLLHIHGVGVEACLHVADPALDLDECVQRGQVNGAAGCVGRRVFLDDFIGLGKLRFDEEVAYGAGDVGFRLAAVVAVQDGGGELLELGVFDVGCHRTSVPFIHSSRLTLDRLALLP